MFQETTEDGKKNGIDLKELDIIFKILDGENDVTLTDKNGIVLRVSDNYEKHYGISKGNVVGKTVRALEEERVFYPSVTDVVIKNKCKATIVQKNKVGHMILTTGVPIFDDDGELQYVVSFNSIDIVGLTTMQEKYLKLKELMAQFNSDLWIKDTQLEGIVVESDKMKRIIGIISQIADTDTNILITGDTGVGKSMIAKLIHNKSRRSNNPFVEINCGTIPTNLIESELFGYVGGAFTGANSKGKIGKIESANGGTLFLDEIGELSINLQIELLHVIQERVITKVGSTKSIKVDFRLIVATNTDLNKAVDNGSFRKDLYYRLNVIPIHIPSIKERPEDISPLIYHFLNKFNSKYEKNFSLSKEVEALLNMKEWPGNIRQIENSIERLVVMAQDDFINIEQLEEIIGKDNGRTQEDESKQLEDFSFLKSALESYEKRIFTDAYNKYKTSIAVGKALGISQSTAARKLRKYIQKYSE